MREDPAYKLLRIDPLGCLFPFAIAHTRREEKRQGVGDDDDARLRPDPSFACRHAEPIICAGGGRSSSLRRPLSTSRRTEGRRETRAGGERPRENGSGLPIKVKPAPKTKEVKHSWSHGDAAAARSGKRHGPIVGALALEPPVEGQLTKALGNYETYHGLVPGSATVGDLRASKFSMRTWAQFEMAEMGDVDGSGDAPLFCWWVGSPIQLRGGLSWPAS